MEKLPYLKDLIQTNIPVVVRITKRIGQYPETDYNTKQETGRMQTLYNFTMPDGRACRHYAKEREEETLSMFSAGEDVQVVRQEKKNDAGKLMQFLVWTPKDGAEARLAANPPVQSNTQQTATKRELDKKEKDDQERWAKNDIGKVLGMLLKIAMMQDGDFDKALVNAKKWRPLFLAAVDEQYMHDVVGTNKVSPETSVKVPLPAHVAEAFGIDPSPTL